MQNPDVGVFVGEGRKCDRSGETLYYKKPDALTFERLCQWMDGGNFMQPSCFFRRTAWEACGPLDENVHIALDVDLWLKMIKRVQFMPIDKLLSSAMIHDGAKTTAMINRMTVDCALVITRAGGEKYVRQQLYNLADKLTGCEKKFEELASNPIVRLLRPLLKNRFLRRGRNS
jgi:hypothetical protein